eukprot:TRINITY_DN12163_c0_g1_i1.p1 TRINITY_DN12163_c0_g1~~TRINITY_DN12163_c0_g1_i1.p1  ORF type:complete len:1206 (+),score=299.41 TRINITY_DN12163_c0_g1_i1:122-3739(+)
MGGCLCGPKAPRGEHIDSRERPPRKRASEARRKGVAKSGSLSSFASLTAGEPPLQPGRAPPAPQPPGVVVSNAGRWGHLLSVFPGEGANPGQLSDASVYGPPETGLVNRLGPPGRTTSGSMDRRMEGSTHGRPNPGGNRGRANSTNSALHQTLSGGNQDLNSSVSSWKSRVEGDACKGIPLDVVDRELAHLAVLHESKFFAALRTAGVGQDPTAGAMPNVTADASPFGPDASVTSDTFDPLETKVDTLSPAATPSLTVPVLMALLGTDYSGLLGFAKGLNRTLTRLLTHIVSCVALRGVCGKGGDVVTAADVEVAVGCVVARLTEFDETHVFVGLQILARIADALLTYSPDTPATNPLATGHRRRGVGRRSMSGSMGPVAETAFHIEPLTPLLSLLRETIAYPGSGLDTRTSQYDVEMRHLGNVLRTIGLLPQCPTGAAHRAASCLETLPLRLFPGEAKGALLYLACVSDLHPMQLVGIRRHRALDDAVVQLEPQLGFAIQDAIANPSVQARIEAQQKFVRIHPLFLDKHGHLERGVGHGMRRELFQLAAKMLSAEHLPEEYISSATAFLRKGGASAVLAVNGHRNLSLVDIDGGKHGSSYDDSIGIQELPLWSRLVFLGTHDGPPRHEGGAAGPAAKGVSDVGHRVRARAGSAVDDKKKVKGVYEALAEKGGEGGRHHHACGPEECFAAEVLQVERVEKESLQTVLFQHMDGMEAEAKSEFGSLGAGQTNFLDVSGTAGSIMQSSTLTPSSIQAASFQTAGLAGSQLNQTLQTLAALNLSMRTDSETHSFRLQLHRPCDTDMIATGLLLQRKHMPLFAVSGHESWFHSSHQEAEDEPANPFILRAHFIAGWLMGQAVANGSTLNVGLPPLFFRLLQGWEYGVGCEISRDAVLLYRGELADAVRNIFDVSDEEFDEVLAGEDLEPGLTRSAYCDLFLTNFLKTFIFHRMEAFVKGFRSTGIHRIPVYATLSPHDLCAVVQGRTNAPTKDFTLSAEFILAPSRNFFDRPHNEMFWKLVHVTIDDGLGAKARSDRAALRKRAFLKFVTGSDLLPAQPRQERLRFDIPPVQPSPSTARDYDKLWGRLPSAHTCTSRLDLPNYMECLIFSSGSEWYTETGVRVGSKITNEHRKCAWGHLDEMQQERILQALRARVLDALLCVMYETASYDGEAGETREGEGAFPIDPMRHSVTINPSISSFLADCPSPQ